MTQFVSSGFFALRTPLLPFDELLLWNEGLEAPASLDNPTLEHALLRDRTRLRVRLLEAVSRPGIREALFIASPHLEDAVDVWVQQPDTDHGRGIERALVRYFVRMAGRATPFGLCAGSCAGTVGDETRLALAKQSKRARHTRLGMDYLFALTQALQRDPVLREALKYCPNSTLHNAAGRVRYVESRLKENECSYHLVATRETEQLSAVLKCAAKGAGFKSLVQALEGEITRDEANAYIAELITNGILVPDNVLSVTGREPVYSLMDTLREHPATAGIAEKLDEICLRLSEMDVEDQPVAPARYRELADELKSLPATVKLEQLFQVDMIPKASHATLGAKVATEIMRAVRLLHGIAKPRNEEITSFRNAFLQRFEGREVMLLEALDEESGVPFGTAHEATARLAGFPVSPIDETVPWGVRERLLLRKLSDALESSSHEIELTTADFEKMATNPPPLPDAFSVAAAIAAASEAAISAGDYRLLIDGVMGPSGARLLGRFCYADAELRQHVERHLRAEEELQPDAIFAEIVYLPEGHFGNVVCRPSLRAYEIPYLGSAGVSLPKQIATADLMLSVVDGRFLLRSACLGREIVPRTTAAYNPRISSLGVYQFLCALQGQRVASNLSWDWGALRDAPFLPRITTGRLVLCRAQWHLAKADIKQLVEKDDVSLYKAIQSWRAEKRLPRWIALFEEDNLLPIDLDNILSIETLAHLIRNREEARVIEMFPAPDELCVRGPEGRFCHELVIPFIRTSPARKPDSPWGHAETVGPLHPAQFSSSGAIPRFFPPGSEWLYAKLYTGTATADDVLREIVAPLVREIIGAKAADRWFFIRYADPETHLRLRFHGDPKKLHSDVLPLLQHTFAKSLQAGTIWRVQFDTYEREVERYGGSQGVILGERIWHADSDAVMSIVSLLEPGDAGLDERWLLAFAGIDSMLTGFGFDAHAKSTLPRQVPEILQVKKKWRDELSEKFRKDRASLESLLRLPIAADHELAPGLEILRERDQRLAPVMTELKALASAGQLAVPLSAFAMICAHMFANRLLRSAQEEQEPVIYDFLSRIYLSEVARVRAD